MKKIFCLSTISLILLLFNYPKLMAQTPTQTGLWKFDDNTNLLKAETGTDLQLIGTHQETSGPTADNGAVTIGVGSYYSLTHGIFPNGGGTYVNEFTIQIDFKVKTTGLWYTFFQTNLTNSNDGDCFINPSGNIGVAATGYSSYSVKPNEWYRLVISVKNGTHYKYFLDGNLLLAGNTQTIDGRFSLENKLLLFADDNSEDGEIDCAEIAIWNYPLDNTEIKNLGGYGHQITAPGTTQLLLVPYLQNPSPTSMIVSWHDTLATLTRVDYGTTASLGQSVTGTSEIVFGLHRWHTVELTGLLPNREYFYKIVSGSGNSSIYNFKTFPDSNYNGKIRILLFSDTHNSDTAKAVRVIKESKKTIQQIYGSDLHNQVNLVLHSGDLVVTGSSIAQWTEQYFAPMSHLSPYIPFLTVTGNHEGEHQNYYKYMHYDNISGYPPPNGFAEKFWSTVIANTMIIGLNTNLTGAAQTLQNMWLEQILDVAENNPKIDFVFLIGHHFSITELWGEGITYDGGPPYIKFQVFPLLKKYSKVIQYSYGHTHGFERGTIESDKPEVRGDFRIVCGGGGGGAIDRWGSYQNQDFPNIHITLDHFFYQIIEIDVANKTFESKMYSLGNTSRARDNEVMDSWYIKINKPAPAQPVTDIPTINESQITFKTSPISNDSLMTVRIQISENSEFNVTAIDTMIHWKNIYQVDAGFNPIDKNNGLDLTRLSFNNSRFKKNTPYFYRVKYRDHNLKWSNWSNMTSFNITTDLANTFDIPTTYSLSQNYPNPFNPATIINYQLPVSCYATLKVYDMLGNEVVTLVNEYKQAGSYKHQLTTNKLQLSSGVYFYRLQAGTFTDTKKFIIMK